MYFKTSEEKILWTLWQVFNGWVAEKHQIAELGIEVVDCELLCPVCKTGKIVNYGLVEEYHTAIPLLS